MIAKRAPRRAPHRTSFKRLAAYLLREGQGGERIRFARAVNCGFDDVELAVKEIAATQALNTRARSDLTYHLIVSFPVEDSPRLADAVLEDAERTLVEALGYQEHQRLSVVHDDTDHVHLHVAINKAHPETLRAHTPRGDFLALGAACAELERRHGLAEVRHVGQRGQGRAAPAPPTPARDMEAHAAQASFHTWIADRRPVLSAELAAAADWSAVHTALAAHDLALVERGAGFAVASRSRPAATIKASAIDRSLSRAALEDRLGPYEPPTPADRHQRHAERYEPAPLAGRGSLLWRRYQEEREAAITAKKTGAESIRAEREEEIERIRAFYRQRRAAVTADVTLSARQKRDLHRSFAVARKAAYAEARETCREGISSLDEQSPVASWGDWLRGRALDGDAAAAAILRDRTPPVADRDRPNAIRGQGEGGAVTGPRPQAVRHNGDAIHDLPGRPRDAGRTVLAGPGTESARGALQLAGRKWNGPLDVAGDPDFRRAAAATAGADKLPVRFADPALDRRRRAVASLSAPQRAAHLAVDKWIDERNETRGRTSDAKPLRQHAVGDRGDGTYAGIRRVADGLAVALVERDAEVLAVRISDRQAQRFRTHPIGTPVRCDPLGRFDFARQRAR